MKANSLLKGNKYDLPFWLEVQQQEEQQVMLTPSKLNFSSGFAVRSRRELQATGSTITIQWGNICCSNKWMPTPFSFGDPGDHSFTFPQALMAHDRHFPQQRAAAQPWGWWVREALETQRQRSRCHSSLGRASFTSRVLLSCVFSLSSSTWVCPQFCCNWPSSSWRRPLVSGSETVRNFSPTSMIKEYMACHLWRITALLFKRKKK